jgi:hypothetical protein
VTAPDLTAPDPTALDPAAVRITGGASPADVVAVLAALRGTRRPAAPAPSRYEQWRHGRIAALRKDIRR